MFAAILRLGRPCGVAGFVCVLLTAVLIGCGGAPTEPPPRSINPFALPTFSLPTPNGGTLSSDSIKGRITLINFWSTWSPASVRQAQDLADLRRRFADYDLQVIGIAVNSGSGPEDIQAFVQHSRLDYPVAVADREFHHKFQGIDSIPTTFVVAPDGLVVNRFSGLALPSELDHEIRYLIGREKAANQ